MKAVFALLLAGPVWACTCDRRQSVCNEVASPGAVFIGTVESTAPSFMSRWFPIPRPALKQLNAANDRYLADRTVANFTALKDALRQLFPKLPAEDRQRLDGASTHAAVVSLFTSVLSHGQSVHFRARTVFRSGDDDTADDDDDAHPPESFDVWTPYGDCGVDFQPGETYLVYAGNDEETGVLETDSCTRTRRLTDAGDDLAYLFFYRDRKHPAGRLEGFATFDPLYQAHRSADGEAGRIDQPAPGVIVELRSPSGTRYTTSAASGAFVFDGLEAGDHTLTAYAAGFPEPVKVLSGPRRFHTAARACASETLLIPRNGP